MGIQFSNIETLVFAIFLLFLGSYITNRVAFLKKYNIPTPVTGGVILSIVITCIHAFDIDITFSPELGNVLLLAFYTTIGLSAKFRLLLEGGRLLVYLLIAAVIFLVLQDTIGVIGAYVTGLSPLVGLLAGSITLTGGHGTGTAYAEIFTNEFGLQNALEIALACATFGLVAAGLLGGPLTNYLIKRHKLKVPDSNIRRSHKQEKTARPRADEDVNYHNMLETILLIALSISIGVGMNKYLSHLGLSMPDFVLCLFVGIIITNLFEFVKSYQIRPKPLALCSNVSLDIFLAIALMRLELWSLFDLALPLLLILTMQVFFALLFIGFIIFRISGKDYDGSVISGGFVGFGLGATPTAIANMSTVTKAFGPSTKAFLLIPLVGAFFIDIVNALVIQGFLFLPWVQHIS